MKKIVVIVFALCCALVGLPAAAETPSPTKDPGLQQTVSADESAGTGRAELGQGHVDVGPRMTEKGFEFLARDDTKSPPVWRNPADILIRVHDAAELAIPAGKEYEFLGIPAGKTAYVIPQTQNPAVVWLGWNTQDPRITETIDRGAKLVYQRHQGPGSFNVFLQNGFDAPQPLWQSAKGAGQEIWVDVNTHTHANWVFSEPGVHLVEMTVQAKGVDGKEYSSTGVLRFAVGDAVSADEAFAAAFPAGESPSAAPSTTTSAAPGEGEDSDEAEGGFPWLPVGIGAGLLLIAAAVAWTVLRGRRERAAAEAELDGAVVGSRGTGAGSHEATTAGTKDGAGE